MIKANKISHKYANQILFENLSFKVNPAEKFVIRGNSGGGKSTILMAIAGVLTLNGGTIYIDNGEMNTQNAAILRKKMCWLPQNPAIIGKGNVRQLISEKFNYSDIDFNEQLVIDNLQKLNLIANILEKSFEQLSGGEKQRIAIIICKMLGREIMLLDEPTSALDSTAKSLAANYLLDDATTIISVSHDEEWIAAMNNSVLI